MDSSEDSAIESKPPPAFNSLRSRFEQLSVETSPAPGPSRAYRGLGGFLPPPEPTNPRPRAVSSTPQDNRPLYDPQLRNVSSSSDLRSGDAQGPGPLVKKLPPPPPPRNNIKGAAASPTPSPSLRPVPMPPNGALNAASPGSSSMRLEDDAQTTPRMGGVASLRSKFLGSQSLSPPRSLSYSQPQPQTTPRQLQTRLQAEFHLEHNLLDLHTPALPPRHANTVDGTSSSPYASPSPGRGLSLLTTTTVLPSSGGSLLDASSPRIELHSPFSDSDEEDSPSIARLPPLVPPRPGVNRPLTHSRNGSGYGYQQPMSSGSSLFSTDSDGSTDSPTTNISLQTTPRAGPIPMSIGVRPSVTVPPPPPPRPKIARTNSNINSITDSSPSSASSPLGIPPPLPVRRATAMAPEADVLQHVQPARPPLPTRPITISPETMSPLSDRSKPIGRLPPPPTRTIALGEKLPPARRPPTPSSDEDSGDDSGINDSLPDSSRSSRRPPRLTSALKHNEMKITVPAHTGFATTCGSFVLVGSGHHLKIYDLAVSDYAMWSLDSKNLHGLGYGLRDAKLTCMDLKPSFRATERGCYAWVGTREGHIIEVDVRIGQVAGVRPSAHNHHLTHIFRYGQSMITLDHGGKALIFSSGAEGEDVQLNNPQTQPRVYRIAEKQDFIRMLGGKLWTSARADTSGSAATARPIVRIYDIFTPGSAGRSLVPSDHVGPVTSGCIIPSQPHSVYLGHEGGYISIWALETSDGIPACVEVTKISNSDVLSVEGVADRLWTGGRKGMITAYDVSTRPWVATNCWNAHDELPVLKLAVDPFSIEKIGRLSVISVGRDEQIRIWDGLMGTDWIDQELLKREKSFSTFRTLSMLVVSWNIDAAKPDALTTDPSSVNFLRDVLTSVDSPDIISFGFQEVIDLESRKMTARTVLLGSRKKGHDEGISEKVTSSYKRWHDRLVSSVRLAMPPDSPYTVIETENLVGLFSCMFIKNCERLSLKDVAITTIKRGMGGRYGNKGGIVARFTIDDSSICMINCHLAAGQHHVRQRNADVAAMVEEKSVLPAASSMEESIAYVGGGDGSMVMDHEIVIVNGDMNYRIDYRREPIITAIESGDLDSLMGHDQLIKQMKFNKGFRFRTFTEGALTFAPTYKYDRGSTEYDTSEKRRLPAWCDRILWRSRVPERVKQLHYRRWEANVSDHRPISAAFSLTVKSVRPELRANVKGEVQGIWSGLQRDLLLAAKEYYTSQALI